MAEWWVWWIGALIAMGIEPAHLHAGLAGGIVRSLLSPFRNLFEMFAGGAVGLFSAIYVTPLILFWLGIPSTELQLANAVAFGIGIIGMSLAEGLIRMAQRWSEKPALPTDASLAGLASAVNPVTPTPVVEDVAQTPEDVTEPEEKPATPKRRTRQSRRSPKISS